MSDQERVTRTGEALGERLRQWDPARRLGDLGAEEAAEIGRALRREALRLEGGGSRVGWPLTARRWVLAGGALAALGLILVLARGSRAPEATAPGTLALQPSAGQVAPETVAEGPTALAEAPAAEETAPGGASEAPLPPAGAPIEVARVTPAVAGEAAGELGKQVVVADGAPRAAGSSGAGDRIDLEMTAANGVRIYWAIQISPGA